MSISDIVSIFNLAEPVRAAIPWPWRPYFSDWLIWAILFALAAAACAVLHVALARKSNIEWSFETGAPIVGLASRGTDAPKIVGIQMEGINVSAHDLHQVDGKIVLRRGHKELPLYAAIAGQWVPVTEVDTIPQRGHLIIGGPLGGENYWTEFRQETTLEEFLRDFGGFDLDITIDGQKYAWSFSIDELRDRIGRTIKKFDEERAKGAPPPQVTRKPVVAR